MGVGHVLEIMQPWLRIWMMLLCSTMVWSGMAWHGMVEASRVATLLLKGMSGLQVVEQEIHMKETDDFFLWVKEIPVVTNSLLKWKSFAEAHMTYSYPWWLMPGACWQKWSWSVLTRYGLTIQQGEKSSGAFPTSMFPAEFARRYTVLILSAVNVLLFSRLGL